MKLYLVEIGGMRDGNLFECHEVHAMVAASELFGYREEAPGISTPPRPSMTRALSCETLLPTIGPFPVTWQTRAMGVLQTKNGDYRRSNAIRSS